MTQLTEEQAIEQGHECAMAALTAQKDNIASLSRDERLYWWFGFITAAMGAAMASIGESAVRALRAAFDDGHDTLHTQQRAKPIIAGIESIKKRTKRTYVRDLVSHGKKKA